MFSEKEKEAQAPFSPNIARRRLSIARKENRFVRRTFLGTFASRAVFSRLSTNGG
jgi:hypothetical protein